MCSWPLLKRWPPFKKSAKCLKFIIGKSVPNKTCAHLFLFVMSMLTPLRNWHNKRIREMCRVTMHRVELYGITLVELQKRIGIWDLD